jgi:hypothetical protein
MGKLVEGLKRFTLGECIISPLMRLERYVQFSSLAREGELMIGPFMGN